MAPKNLSQGFGDEVRSRRASLGYSQAQLAGLAGLHRNYVGAIERGDSNPSLAAVEAIAKALNARPSQLVSNA
jgi:transcriptional regulator with XRE-family HTH domain